MGDQLDFGGLLGYAPVMPVNQFAGTTFAHRGGRMPAPLNSLKTSAAINQRVSESGPTGPLLLSLPLHHEALVAWVW